ncbi:hypothetical protein [Cedecea sp.]|jgi:hypothetical protein|uniref:glycosyltransferase family 2 protein n=1 Tax=Cedecea sp. TaxID=1970739 RepID=UPI002F40D2BC
MSLSLEYPYLLVAPDYRESSLGIQVMHRLCHMINEAGGRAWMVGCTVNPRWNTPALTNEAYQTLLAGNQPWIAVYPEVVSGNPLSAPICVRYMLNREGVIAGNTIDAGPDDLFFWYRDEFAEKDANPKLLKIESYDIALFQDDGGEKDLDLLYINRVPEDKIDWASLPANITVLSMRKPLTFEQLAAVLKRGRRLYTYESSGTCILALLCGCPVIGLEAKGYEVYALNARFLLDYGEHSFTKHDTPEALNLVRQHMGAFRESFLSQRAVTDRQFEVFLQVSQHAAEKLSQRQHRHTLTGWAKYRTLPLLPDTLWPGRAVPRLLVVINQGEHTTEAVSETLNSLLPQLASCPGSRVWVVGKNPEIGSEDQSVEFVAVHDWKRRVQRYAERAAFDWLHCIDAGVTYVAEGLTLCASALSSAGDCKAIYPDEALMTPGGVYKPAFKPDFNLDLFLSSPHRYLRRGFIERQALLDVGGLSTVFGEAYEFDLAIKLLSRFDIAALGHFSELVSIVPDALFEMTNEHEEQQILEAYLRQRGFVSPQATRKPAGVWRLNYGSPTTEMVSILILAGDDPAVLNRCVTSLIHTTQWLYYEVIIAQPDAVSEAMQQVIRHLVERYPDRVRSALVNGAQHPVAMLNHAAHTAHGSQLLLIDNTMLFVLDNWLTELLNHALRPEVGLVGPKIINTSQQVFSAGLVLGGDEWIGQVGWGAHLKDDGYMARLQSDQNYSALSHLCMLFRKSAWESVGGFSDAFSSIELATTAFCLALRERGYFAVWTPFSIVASDRNAASFADRRYGKEKQSIIARYASLFSDDPAYNKKLSLRFPLFTEDRHLAQSWNPLKDTGVPTFLVVGGEPYAGHVARFIQLCEATQLQGKAHFCILADCPTLPEMLRLSPQGIVLFGGVNNEICLTLSQYKALSKCSVKYLAGEDDDSVDENAAPAMHIVDSWLAENAEQQARLAGKGHVSQLLPAALVQSWFVMPEGGEKKRVKKAALCMPARLDRHESAFMARLIEATAEKIDWILLGEHPKQWLPWVKETRRIQGVTLSAAQIHDVSADVLVLPQKQGEKWSAANHRTLREFAACGIPTLNLDTTLNPLEDAFERLLSTHEPDAARILAETTRGSYAFSELKIEAFVHLLSTH